MREIHTDVAVIGAGTAGLAAYRRAKAAGAKALIIEGGAYGTTCARVGCMPSKLMIAASEAVKETKHFKEFGIDIGKISIDGRAVMDRVKRERDRFVGFVIDSTMSIPEEDRISGYGQYLDQNTIKVGDDLLIHTRASVIATGSSPFIPDNFKVAGDRLVVNDDVFEWDTLPKSVAVFGLGVIGLEIGAALAGLGVHVHLFGVGGRVGPLSDPEVIEEAKKIFSKELNIDYDAKVEEISKDEKTGDVVIRYFDKKTQTEVTESFEYLLSAVGRRPNLLNLGIGNLNIAVNNNGIPLFNPVTLQCGDSSIFIAGDANNYLPLLHEASDEGAAAGRNAATWPEIGAFDRRSTMAVVFSDPQIMMVGTRYRDLNLDTTSIGEVDFGDQGRSRVMLKNKGRLRVYADKESLLFLGAEMIGPRAENLAHLLAWAHQMEMTIPLMLQMPFYHPVIEEGLRTALRDVMSKSGK